MNSISFCQMAIKILNKTNDFGRAFVSLRLIFHHRYQKGIIFSTRFGAEFFSEVLERLKNNKEILPEIVNGVREKLGPYDISFNFWLAAQNKQKST